MELELASIPGQTVSQADIQKRLDELEARFNTLLEQAAEQMDGQNHMAEFQSITNEISALKAQRLQVESQYKNYAAVAQRINTTADLLREAPSELIKWDETIIRQLVDTVKVASAEGIVVYLQGGIGITQQITN